jgi:hypothetical protein
MVSKTCLLRRTAKTLQKVVTPWSAWIGEHPHLHMQEVQRTTELHIKQKNIQTSSSLSMRPVQSMTANVAVARVFLGDR